MNLIVKFFELLSPDERRRLYLLFAAVLVMAGLEVVSVASIMPFLSVAADPASIHEKPYLHWTFETLGFTSNRNFLIALGLGAFTALVLSNAFIVITTWALEHYVWGRNHSLSCRLFRCYLDRPYDYFLTHNSAELGKNILQEVREVTGQMLQPALKGVSKGVVALFIVGFLVFVDPLLSSVIASVLGTAYIGIYFVVRERLNDIGDKRVRSNTERYQFVNEAFSAIKEVKLRSKEEAFLEQFETPSKRWAWIQAHYRVIKTVPRYLLEAIAFGGIILVSIYFIVVQENFRQIIPMMGLYAFAGYRLMPALQQAFRGFASANFNIAALSAIHHDIQKTQNITSVPNTGMQKAVDESLRLSDCLTLDSVTYTYPGADEPAVDNLSMEIPAATKTAIVGKTGSGKTTTIDLILGLLRPQKGNISIDGTELDKANMRRWQRNVGYVPQQIRLSDDTIAQNVAFGVSEKRIDIGAVKQAAKHARIHDFVEQLPEGWETEVGERGVKLSGGQRQRIGIARALYHKPGVLVLDEATSALDQATEEEIMTSLNGLGNEITVIMVSHGVKTVSYADKVVLIEAGKNKKEGEYDNVMSIEGNNALI